jgi:hypothetical protein
MHHGTEKLKDMAFLAEAHQNYQKGHRSTVGAGEDDARSPWLLRDRGGNQVPENQRSKGHENASGRFL